MHHFIARIEWTGEHKGGAQGRGAASPEHKGGAQGRGVSPEHKGARRIARMGWQCPIPQPMASAMGERVSGGGTHAMACTCKKVHQL